MSTSLYSAIEQVINLMNKCSNGLYVERNAWDELVKNFSSEGTIAHEYTEPVRDAIRMLLEKISEENKRTIWSDSEAGMNSKLCDGIHISGIEMDLEEELFSEVIDLAFEQATDSKH